MEAANLARSYGANPNSDTVTWTALFTTWGDVSHVPSLPTLDTTSYRSDRPVWLIVVDDRLMEPNGEGVASAYSVVIDDLSGEVVAVATDDVLGDRRPSR